MKFLLTAILLIASLTSYSQRIWFFVDSHEFGQAVKDTSFLFYKFPLKNDGDKILVIHNVETGCGCTSYTLPSDSIQPGESGAILIHYDRMRPGPFNQTIKVHSNDPVTPEKQLFISGEIIYGRKLKEKRKKK